MKSPRGGITSSLSLERLAAAGDVPGDVDPLAEIAMTPFQSTYGGFENRPVYESFSKILAKTLKKRGGRFRRRADWKKLRIGIVQEQPGNSSPYRLMLGWLRDARRNPDVHIIFLEWMPSDGSGFKDGSTMNKVKRACHETVELPFSLVQSRQRISDLSLDVLIFPAIAASPFQISLTLTRLARVQMIFGHGHPVTSGSEAIDYFISSDFFHDSVRAGNADVNVDADHTEQLVRFRSLSIKWDAGYLPPGVPSIGSRDSLDTSLSKETLHDMLAALYAGQRLQYRRLPHARFLRLLAAKGKVSSCV